MELLLQGNLQGTETRGRGRQAHHPGASRPRGRNTRSTQGRRVTGLLSVRVTIGGIVRGAEEVLLEQLGEARAGSSP